MRSTAPVVTAVRMAVRSVGAAKLATRSDIAVPTTSLRDAPSLLIAALPGSAHTAHPMNLLSRPTRHGTIDLDGHRPMCGDRCPPHGPPAADSTPAEGVALQGELLDPSRRPNVRRPRHRW